MSPYQRAAIRRAMVPAMLWAVPVFGLLIGVLAL